MSKTIYAYFNTADLTGIGKGRGAARVIYQIVDGTIEIFDVTLKHYKP